jgi:hypothetical protein
VEQEEAAIGRQRRGEHISAATNQHATTEELLEAVFSVWVRAEPGKGESLGGRSRRRLVVVSWK